MNISKFNEEESKIKILDSNNSCLKILRIKKIKKDENESLS